jgi:predicted dehydrogenase
MKYDLTRRHFMGTLAAAAAGMTQVSCSTYSLGGRKKIGPRRTNNEQVHLGFIGMGWQGNANLDNFLNIPDCRVVAISDIDQQYLAAGISKVNGRYQNEACQGYADFRELLTREDLDAVCISTPDHWHALQAIAAVNAGMDVFCEKPLTHSLAEGVATVDAVRRNRRIWQTGSWQRSQGLFRWAAQIVQNGYLGKVTRVEVGLPSGHADYQGTGNNQPDSEPPAHVDYNMWIGPARMMPFNASRFHKNWRWNYNTGGGQLMDWIGHHLDIAHWGLANPEYGCGPDDEIGPLTVSATAQFPDPGAIWNTAIHYRIECAYPNDVEVLIADAHSGGIEGGAKWYGPNGWLRVDRGHISSSEPDFIREIQARERDGTLDIQLYQSPGHWVEFIDSVKSRQRTLTPVEVAHCSQAPGHLGHIAALTGRKLTWDAKRQQIVGDDEAAALMGRDLRAPWAL